ncbi:MAG: cbb3-type cytochrome c oxidase subunit I, partial [Verrucomicrobiota bacterium]
FSFWGIALFGGWGLIPVNAPLPSWIPALSSVMAILMILPVLGVAINLRGTTAGYTAKSPNPILALVRFGAFSFVLAQEMNILSAIRPINEVLAFTYFTPATNHWILVGFFASVMFGAIYYIVPLVLNVEPFLAKKIRDNALMLFGGVVLYGAALAIGGILQGINLNKPEVAFTDVVKGTFPFLGISTLGNLLLIVAGLMLMFNLLSATGRAGLDWWKKSGARS